MGTVHEHGAVARVLKKHMEPYADLPGDVSLQSTEGIWSYYKPNTLDVVDFYFVVLLLFRKPNTSLL